VTIGAWTRRLPRLVAALLFALLLAVPAAAHADHHPEPSVETVSCTSTVDGWPAFSSLVDVSYTIYEGDREYTILDFFNPRGTVADDGETDVWYFVSDFTGGGELAPNGPPNVVVHGDATIVRLRWSWELALVGVGVGAPGWYVDGKTPVSCSDTTYVGP